MSAIQATESSTSDWRPQSGSWLLIAIVFFVALICFLPLPANSPLAATEGHRAITAHQMVESGEWLVPRMFGRVYLAKPPLHYWLQATFETLSGRGSPFIWRLPSTVEAALLAAVLCWLASRWFGTIAGPVGGFAYVALVAMWGQDRGADIDLTNAFVSTIAAICLLELHFGPAQLQSKFRRTIWITIGGIAIGASFLTKGPCGLPPILGAMIWIAVTQIRARRASQPLRPVFWLPLIIGILIFALYAYATYSFIQSHHMAADMTGIQEGTQDLHPHDWSWERAVGWVLLPAIMFVYALPVSIALPFSFLPEVRAAQPNLETRSRMIALAATILLAWLVCFISGMHLPRYAYVTLPLLCPLAGAVASIVPKLRPPLMKLAILIASGSTLIFGGMVLVLSGVLWQHSHLRPLLIATALIAVLVTTLVLRSLGRAAPNWRALFAVPILLICLAQNTGYMGHFDRLRRSSLAQAEMIRSVTGPDAHLVTCMMVLDQPDLFYYAGLPTKAFDGDMLDWHDVPPGTWVVLEPPEKDKWESEVPDRLKRVIHFVANKNDGYLVWYDVGPATKGS